MMVELDILNGFTGKVVSDCIDIAIDKIKKADENRKAKNQTIETRIYQVIVDSLNYFTYNKFKGKDKLYYASESILKGLKCGKGNAEAVKSGLKMLVSDVNNDICKDFLETACREICRDENNDLYKEIVMIRQAQGLEELKIITQNQNDSFRMLGDIKEDTRYIRESLSKKEIHELEYCDEIPTENRAKEYAKKWNKNVFLNDFNKRDKDAGVNIKLKDIYLEEHLPHYKWRADDEPLTDLKTLLKEYIIDSEEKKMLLILGQPGIGKSTLITWIMANLVERNDDIYVYQFASDLKNINWLGNDILKQILKTLGLKYDDIEGKTLILDGFDEMSIDGDREKILIKINEELEGTNILKKFSLIITCRENYVGQSDLGNILYITLQAWNEDQINSFCEVFEREDAKKNPETVVSRNAKVKINKILENKEILGIPLILYMILALNVDFENNSSIANMYDQIFSLKKDGIYDRCYDREHRINSPEIKEHIHQISQRIAFWMFENNAERASIPQKKFKEVCEIVMNEADAKSEDIQRDALIGNYFAPIKHCEGVRTDELRFVHRSIYEYFVVVYFFESVHKLKSVEELAGKLGELLKDGRLSEQILQFIKYKFDSVKGYDLSDITQKTFNIMLRDGMTYYTAEKYKNTITRERNIFSNMLEIVLLWNDKLGRTDKRIKIYLESGFWGGLNLRGADLREVKLFRVSMCVTNLRKADLSKANFYEGFLCNSFFNEAILCNSFLLRTNLSEACLVGAKLSGAILSGADLRRADLRGADLRGADLSEADLSKANLINTLFDERQIDILYKNYDLSDSRVYTSETNETISYKEYCIRKKKK